MAARLSLTRANVTTPDGLLEQVSILVRNGTARVTQLANVLAARDGVTAVEKPANATWTVRFSDGSSWSVERLAQPCGCN